MARTDHKFRLLVSDRWVTAVTVAVLLASTTLLPLTNDRAYLVLSSILVVILGLLSLVLRRFRVGDVAVLGFQAITLAGFVFAVSLGMPGEGNPFIRFSRLLAEATTHMQTQAPPMDPHPGVRLLFVAAIGLIMALTDVMVQSIDRPMWSLAPLASLFLVPALALENEVPWWCFVAIAVGYLGILLAEGINTSERWPRGVRRSRHDRGSAPLALRMALVVGVPGVVLTLALGLVIPILTSQGWGITQPKGDQGPLQMADPTLDLRRNLNQPQDRVVMTYTTTQDDGPYLRMASLPVFNATGWQNAGLQLTTGTDLPPAPGYRSEPSEVIRETTIRISDFRSEYLPLPFAPDRFSAPGVWAFDRDSLVVLATGENREDAIRGLEYSVQSIDIEPDGSGLSRAGAGNPPDAQLTVPLPQDIPNDIINLTLEVTNGIDAPALRAAAIQDYLRNSGGFTYSTEPLPGSGYEALQNFLFRDKQGYCEQFAGAMATMARVAGIPSRVAVGFLPGERQPDGSWEVSIHDMHAWPELWFEGYGWVRFEPTPSIASPPPWTVVSGSSSGEEGPTPEPQPTGEVAPEERAPTPTPTPEVGVPGADDGFPLERLLVTAGIVAVLGALGATPMLLRHRRRNSRLEASGSPTQQVENAWAEVRDSVLDFGRLWPAGSPRAIGTQVSHDLDAASAKSMRALSLMVERARYAQHHSINADLEAITMQVRRGLAERSSRADRIAATWWPRSLWHQVTARFSG
jgi:transglutaminase-like putative cysteine protease